MSRTVAVVTTVHWPDDTRIRERLIRTLSTEFDVVYVSRSPGPSDRSGLEYHALKGGRLRRNLSAIKYGLAGKWQVMVVHDPELLACALIARLVRRRAVVFDVHENVPATAFMRPWVPGLLRRPLAAAIRLLLKLAERALIITLAEDGYRQLFRRDHPVFANFPDTTRYPEPAAGDGSVVYLGDVTEERGARVVAEACVLDSLPLRFVGRVSDRLRTDLGAPGIEFTGELPNPTALEVIRGGGVAVAPLLDLPNYRESMPTKILEYLALGLPVVASDLLGTRRLVEGLDAVELVAPADVAALAAAIRRSLEPERRAAAAAQAPLIRERFCWPRDEVLSFYRSLV